MDGRGFQPQFLSDTPGFHSNNMAARWRSRQARCMPGRDERERAVHCANQEGREGRTGALFVRRLPSLLETVRILFIAFVDNLVIYLFLFLYLVISSFFSKATSQVKLKILIDKAERHRCIFYNSSSYHKKRCTIRCRKAIRKKCVSPGTHHPMVPWSFPQPIVIRSNTSGVALSQEQCELLFVAAFTSEFLGKLFWLQCPNNDLNLMHVACQYIFNVLFSNIKITYFLTESITLQNDE